MKQTGDRVRAGEAIAVVGNTGEKSHGPHLHFELWFNGAPINPEEFVPF
jgi:murein DD-endopeptidase MepM/ murein hydrolase activator NlpD